MVDKTVCYSDSGPDASDKVSDKLQEEMNGIEQNRQVDFSKSTFGSGGDEFSIGCVSVGDK